MGMKFAVRALAAAAVLTAGSVAAKAKCTRLAFSVNDYGKEGPTKDAMSLLDKYIAKWTAERGITKYTTGKKDVSCELFLDFGVFDEHTCKAAATVCWPDGPGGAGKSDASAPAKGKPAAANPAAPAEKAPAKVKQPTEAPSAPAPSKVKPKAA
jgi:hypothetical protein